jgi:hypothetical protein
MPDAEGEKTAAAAEKVGWRKWEKLVLYETFKRC